MSAQKLKIFIGTEPNQYVAQQVLIYSIKETLSVPAEIKPIQQQQERKGGTNFGFVRFNVPKLAGYEGKAVYMDADQLVFHDMKEIFDHLDDQHDLTCVRNPVGNFGNKPVPANYNQSSVMVLNCERLKDWNPDTMFDNVVPNRDELGPQQIHYKDFMSLQFMDQSRIKELDPAWNHYNQKFPDSKLVHFSHVRSQPWKNPKHPMTAMWTDWLRRAIKAGYISRVRLLIEIVRGHIHRDFLPLVWGR